MNFKSPIEYINKKQNLSLVVIDDLELINTKNNDDICMLETILKPDTCFGKKNLELWSKYYTQDKNFLLETQKLFQSKEIKKFKLDKENFQEIQDLWDKIEKESSTFISNYNYIEFKKLEFLNTSTFFLEILSVYNIFNPIFTLLTPLLMLILPFLFLFFYLKYHKINFSLELYITILKKMFGNFSIVALLTSNDLSLEKKVTYLFSTVFYFVQLYQSFSFCFKYYKNLIMIQKLIKNMKKYIDITNTNVVIFCNLVDDLNLTTYNEFKDDIKNLNVNLNKLSLEIQNNISIKEISLQKISELGSIMKIFYDINKNKVFKDNLQTSFGFNGYIDHIVQFNKLIENKQINKCYFNKNKIKIKKIYYPKIGYKNSIKNDIVIDKKNIIITGPNAAGKTTILKSIIYNLILSQQIGFGFYEKATVKCYDYFHSYLNIPDTSGRDSLFQAEARRCKEIIDILDKTKDKQHFCIFDELYSGTNPYEAVASAYGYLNYLNKFKNINYVLTTHYINLCKFMKNKVVNKHMKIKSNNDDEYTYTYEYIDGISEIRGGVKVLKDLNYPTNIINNARNLLKKI